jgi:4-amino-4-deoxy-L-arabinose transferase-like glycosyltransferase
MVSGGHRGKIQFILAWLVVVAVGLFVPLMDNDSAHHANIALRMYLTGDYVSLIDYDGPYLDKPHLHFWLSALSYHVFGVTGFAYKFPSFLFSLFGILSVYRAGALLVNETVGKMAALIFATSASFLLALNDVRMDALLTAAVAYSIWQFAGYVKTGRFIYLAGLALGAAIGFCVKGHIGVLIPLLFILSYCYTTHSWRMLWRAHWLLAGMLFFVFISPVVYCYYLQFNLQPELMVRGKNHIDGVRFILWDQSLGRYSGEMGGVGKSDRLFFFHTFLWVFAPWSLLGVAALMKWRPFSSQPAVSKSVFWVLLIFSGLVAFSSFKLPHYLNVILPLAAIWVGALVGGDNERLRLIFRWLEWFVWILLSVFSVLLLIAWFPEQPIWFWAGSV